MVCHRPGPETRLGSVFPVMTVRGWWGTLMCTPPSPPFRRHPLVFRRLAIPHVSLSCFSISIRVSCRLSCLSEVFRLISRAGRRFLPPSRRHSYPGIGLAPPNADRLWSLRPVGGDRLPQDVRVLDFVAWLLGTRSAVRGPA
jgi:hypothetical protein